MAVFKVIDFFEKNLGTPKKVQDTGPIGTHILQISVIDTTTKSLFISTV